MNHFNPHGIELEKIETRRLALKVALHCDNSGYTPSVLNQARIIEKWLLTGEQEPVIEIKQPTS